MKIAPSTRRIGIAVLLAVAVVGASIAFSRRGSAAANEPEDSGAVRVAHSICEAHELRALAAQRPDVRIEIPKQYDKPYPSLSACRAQAAAWDDSAPGPRQPIPFSHRHHAGQYQIPCLYCHSGTDRSQAAGVPSVQVCMGCHNQFPSTFDQELEGIRILKEHWGYTYTKENGVWKLGPRDPSKARPIKWKQIHRLPEYVQFRHNRHVKAGIDCNQCHGNLRAEHTIKVQDLDKLYLVPDTRWWKYGLPTEKLQMGWCIKCHRENRAPTDCLTCHY